MTADKPEQWRDIAGYGGNYKVSSEGRVLSVARRCRTGCPHGVASTRRVPQRILTPFLRRGQATVRLTYEGQGRNICVHILVLEAFVGPRPPGHWGARINRDETDNRLENLRWKCAS
jgi:hypothetical protein